MSILVNLTPEEEAHLFNMATQNGIAPEELIRKLISEQLTFDPRTQKEQVLAKLHQWQRETKLEPRISAHELFKQWDAEAAQMTDAEREAEDQVWEDFQNGINETRAVLGMRPL